MIDCPICMGTGKVKPPHEDKHKSVKYTKEQCIDILCSSATNAQIAKLYGMSDAWVSKVRRNPEIWAPLKAEIGYKPAPKYRRFNQASMYVKN